MRISSFALGAMVFLGSGQFGCSLFTSGAQPAEVASRQRQSDSESARPRAASKHAKKAALPKRKNPFGEKATERAVGDYFVHRFSGSFLGHPLTLTEEVVAQKDGLFLIDYTFEEEGHTTEIHAWTDPESGNVVKASEGEGDAEIEVSPEAFDALLAKTLFVPDINEEQLGSEQKTCLIGPKELDCELKRYRVIVGEKSATLSVARSAELAGRDLSGEIKADDGSLIYRAELLEMGNDAGLERSVAQSERVKE